MVGHTINGWVLNCTLTYKWLLGGGWVWTLLEDLSAHCSQMRLLTVDSLGHHATTFKRGGDAVTHHYLLRDVFLGFCQQEQLDVKIKVGSGLTPWK